MSKQCLSIEQMQHLKELGVDTSKASMKWVNKYQNAFGDNWEKVPVSVNLDTEYYQSFGYAFTLQDVLELLPIKIEGCRLEFDRHKVSYFDYMNERTIKLTRKQNLIDAAYEMLCWVIENGYLKTE